MSRSAVVVCPGRGTYTRESLGYLGRYHAGQAEWLHLLDAERGAFGQVPVAELDAMNHYRLGVHATGDNASALIYSCAMADFMSIDREAFDIVAVTGNSMGWYLTLAAAGACTPQQGMRIVNGMGTLMHREAVGGQVLYPLCDEDWLSEDTTAMEALLHELRQQPGVSIYTSIHLGGLRVFAADDAGVKALMAHLPPREDGRYPMALPHHGAYHSPLMRPMADKAQQLFSADALSAPALPMIDGRGHIWTAYNTEAEALFRYTFEQQICQPYNFSRAIDVALKEFAPDCLIVLGPGNSLGAPIAQQMIANRWRGLGSKNDFKLRQNSAPLIYSMGMDAQRLSVTRSP